MTRFQYCLRVVLGHEGGYSDHPSDRGGATNFGVTQQTYNDFCKITGRDPKPVAEITQDEVEQIYGAYWKAGNCSVLPEPLDLYVFDCAINSGATRAIKLLQRALGVDPDGIYGKQTALAMQEEIAAGNIQELCHQYLEEREGFYHEIVGRNQSQEVFLKGWLARLDHLRDMVA